MLPLNGVCIIKDSYNKDLLAIAWSRWVHHEWMCLYWLDSQSKTFSSICTSTKSYAPTWWCTLNITQQVLFVIEQSQLSRCAQCLQVCVHVVALKLIEWLKWLVEENSSRSDLVIGKDSASVSAQAQVHIEWHNGAIYVTEVKNSKTNLEIARRRVQMKRRNMMMHILKISISLHMFVMRKVC